MLRSNRAQCSFYSSLLLLVKTCQISSFTFTFPTRWRVSDPHDSQSLLCVFPTPAGFPWLSREALKGELMTCE